MCFSATASFSGAAVLITVGAATIARNASPAHRMYATVPLLFGVQQASEGVVWLTMHAPAHSFVHQLAVNTFLAFALIIWPSWLPISLHRIEQDERRKRWLKLLVWYGSIVSAGSLMLMLRHEPSALMTGNSITYVFGGNDSAIVQAVMVLSYILTTAGPLFASSSSMSRVVGTALLVSIALAEYVQRTALTSTWCFFASFVSALIYLAIVREQRVVAAPHRDLVHAHSR